MYIIYRCSQTTKHDRNPKTVLFWGHTVIYFDSSEAGEAENKGKALHVSGQSNSSVVVPLKPQNVSDPQKGVHVPTPRTLRKHMQDIHIYPGFSDSIISALEIKTQTMKLDAKLCAIVMDEMAIKESLLYSAGWDKVEGFED